MLHQVAGNCLDNLACLFAEYVSADALLQIDRGKAISHSLRSRGCSASIKVKLGA